MTSLVRPDSAVKTPSRPSNNGQSRVSRFSEDDFLRQGETAASKAESIRAVRPSARTVFDGSATRKPPESARGKTTDHVRPQVKHRRLGDGINESGGSERQVASLKPPEKPTFFWDDKPVKEPAYYQDIDIKWREHWRQPSSAAEMETMHFTLCIPRYVHLGGAAVLLLGEIWDRCQLQGDDRAEYTLNHARLAQRLDFSRHQGYQAARKLAGAELVEYLPGQLARTLAKAKRAKGRAARRRVSFTEVAIDLAGGQSARKMSRLRFTDYALDTAQENVPGRIETAYRVYTPHFALTQNLTQALLLAYLLGFWDSGSDGKARKGGVWHGNDFYRINSYQSIIMGSGLRYYQVEEGLRSLVNEARFLIPDRHRWANKGGHRNNLFCFRPNSEMLNYVWHKKLNASHQGWEAADGDEDQGGRPNEAA